MAARRCRRRPRLYCFQPPSRQISCCPQACFFMVASGFCRTRHHIRIPAGRRGKGCGLVPTASVPFYRKAHKLSQKPLRHVKFHWPRWATWSRLAEREAGKPGGGLPRLPQVRRPGRRGRRGAGRQPGGLRGAYGSLYNAAVRERCSFQQKKKPPTSTIISELDFIQNWSFKIPRAN